MPNPTPLRHRPLPLPARLANTLLAPALPARVAGPGNRDIANAPEPPHLHLAALRPRLAGSGLQLQLRRGAGDNGAVGLGGRAAGYGENGFEWRDDGADSFWRTARAECAECAGASAEREFGRREEGEYGWEGEVWGGPEGE